MTRVFVFTNHKGGVGKTTSAINTAMGIVAILQRTSAPNSCVLLIDIDSQTHATLLTTNSMEYSKQEGCMQF
jgi:cellulose biosynthesis protein BcsQ